MVSLNMALGKFANVTEKLQGEEDDVITSDREDEPKILFTTICRLKAERNQCVVDDWHTQKRIFFC